MATLTASGAVALPARVIFDYASDYRRMPAWVFGLHSLKPIGHQSEGVGAEFRGTGKIGPVAMTGTSRITEWEPYRRITVALLTNNGIDASATIATTGKGSAMTRVELTADYRFPGGLAGRILQRGVEPFLGIGIRHTERTLREQCLRAG